MAIKRKHRSLARICAASLLSLSIAWPQQSSTPASSGQQPPAAAMPSPAQNVPDTTLTVNTRLVSLDVVVTDKSGRAITDLKKEDFTVLERGQPQRIAAFSLQQPKPSPANKLNPAAPVPPLPPGVYSNRREAVASQTSLTIVLLDALNTPMSDQAYARYEMLKYLKSQHESGQSVAIFALTSRLLLLQDFTSDPNLLRDAIEKRLPQQSHLLTDPDTDRIEMPGASDAIAANIDRFEQDQVRIQNDMRMRLTMDAMQSIARSVSGYPGRKNLIWVSAAFPLSAAFDGDSSAFFNQNWLVDQVHRTATLLTDSQVSVYPVDARGLVGSTLGSASFTGRTRNGRLMNGPQLGNELSKRSFALSSSHDAMRQIADSTGGKAYYNRNDIDHAVALSIADGSTYYTVAYYPEDKDWNGNFRKVEIKLARSGLQARYRHGYYATDPLENTKLSRQSAFQQINAALIDQLPATTITFYGSAFRIVPSDQSVSPSTTPGATAAGTAPNPAEGKPIEPSDKTNKQKIAVRFLVEPSTIARQQRGDIQHFNVDFVVVAFKGENVVGKQSQTLEGNPKPETWKKIMKDGLIYATAIDVPTGNCRLRLLVRDNQSGTIGTLDIPVTAALAEMKQ